MKKLLSHFLKVLLLLFVCGVLLVMTYILPTMANQVVSEWPELAYAKMPILFMSESLLFLLIAGIAVILYLLFLYDRAKVFDYKFIKGLDIIVGFSVLALLFIISLFYYLSAIGGPGPLGVLLVGGTLAVLIIAIVIILIRSIIINGMNYKLENDLTV